MEVAEERITGVKLYFSVTDCVDSEGSLGCRGNAKISALSGLFPRGGVCFYTLPFGRKQSKPSPKAEQRRAERLLGRGGIASKANGLNWQAGGSDSF